MSGQGPTRGDRVDKPWGHELIWAETERYAGKILVIETGRRLSLQYHHRKHESIYVLSGRLRMYLEGEDGEVRAEELQNAVRLDDGIFGFGEFLVNAGHGFFPPALPGANPKRAHGT